MNALDWIRYKAALIEISTLDVDGQKYNVKTFSFKGFVSDKMGAQLKKQFKNLLKTDTEHETILHDLKTNKVEYVASIYQKI